MIAAAGALMAAQGYLSRAYAEALGELGAARFLAASGGWILERPIQNSRCRDAMGCYPVFSCRDWTMLGEDLDDLGTDLVALSVVTDPFGEQDVERLRALFPDLMRPFKRHYVIDLPAFDGASLDAHHRRNIRKGLANVQVERADDSQGCGSEWVRLYSTLIARHQIRGMAAFSASSLRAQLAVPGTVVFKACQDDRVVGMTVWYVSGTIGYYHLAAYDDSGYEGRASYALFAMAIDYFRAQGLVWLGLGAAAGLSEDHTSGLARFKRGWASDTRVVYLCGRVFNPEAYAELTAQTGAAHASYFPAYREREVALASVVSPAVDPQVEPSEDS
jgi:hypothetical protein